MNKFNAQHKQDLGYIYEMFNKYITGQKCNGLEIANTVTKIINMQNLDTCDCNEKKNSLDKTSIEKVLSRQQKEAQLERMKNKEVDQQNGVENGKK